MTAATASARADAHLPQLDGLRTCAVAAVLYTHFMGGRPLAEWTGPVGVRLFFTLSGFLITGILLRGRARVTAGEGVGRQFRVFYARRALRIFPLYYAALAIAWLAGVPDMRDAPLWHALYLTNVRTALLGRWPAWIPHLWSLSVEEQFYLVWPALVLLAPRRALGPAIVAAVAIGPCARVAAALSGANPFVAMTLTPMMLDTLGLGALLAYAQWRAGAGPGFVPTWLRRSVAPAAALALALPFAPPFPGADALARPVADLAMAVVYAWLVARTAGGWRGPVGRALAWAPVRYVGRISYGIYVLHLLVWLAFYRRFHRLQVWPSQLASAALYSAVSVAAATVSWYALERPLNALKRRVPYRAEPSA